MDRILGIATASVFCVSLLVGCAATHKGEAAVAARNAVCKDLDPAVFDVVFQDLSTFHEFQSRIPDARTKPRIVIHKYTRIHADDITPRTFRIESRRPGLEVPTDVVDDINLRNTSSPQLLDYTPVRSDIRVVDLRAVLVSNRMYTTLKEFQARYPDAMAFVHTWLPGYSSDGNNALVRFRVGPQGRGRQSPTATGTYLLTRQNGAWKVEWRTIDYH